MALGVQCGHMIWVDGLPRGCTLLHPALGHPRRNNKSHRKRYQHPHACINGNGAHVRAHKPRDERHGQECGNDSERRENGRPPNLIDSGGNDLQKCLVGEDGLVAVDVFNHHDGIVNQDANRKDKREERDSVDGETVGP